MAGVIDLSDKRAKQKVRQRQDMLQAARRIFLCSGCPSKCSKCGAQLEETNHACVGTTDSVFRFCPACSEEFAEYELRKNGESANRMYWHNEQWVTLWDAWLDYQKSLSEYRKSKEFLELLDDLNS